jgi:outer membrane receptor protein involved in Fe transport
MIARTRRHLLASTLLAGAAAFAAPAHAQSAATSAQEETADVGHPAARLCEDNPTSPECAAQGEAIIVTGSRIASPTLTSVSPLQIVDAQDIDESGVVNIQEVLLENPTFGTPGISRTNSNFASASAGTAIVDLRNLGSNRTLVLVNGRRFIAGVPGSSAVDLNSIPTQFIERIDILTGGASSIYGSDAVAGVVNIIYRDDFEGIELSGQLGVSQHGDDVRKQANLLMGSNFADGRGNISVYLGYSDEGAVFSRNRKRSQVDDISCVLLTGANEDTFRSCAPFFSSFVPQGTIFIRPARAATDLNGDGDTSDPGEAAITALNRTYNASGELIPVLTNGVGGTGQNATGFNRQAFRTIAIPTERYLMALRGNYEITDSISALVEGTFAKSTTTTVIEPFGLDTAGIGGIFPASGGRFPIEQFVALAPGAPVPALGPNVLGCDPVNRVCRVRNPFVQQFIFDNAPDTDGDGLRDVSFTRRLSDFGNRGNTADRTTFRILAGLEGTVFDDWRWDAFYSFGETTESQVSGGQVNVLNFRNALDVIPDVNDVDGDGNRSEAVCRDPQARAQGCVPANVFGGTGAIANATAYLEAPGLLKTKTTQKLAGANLSGNLFDLWGAGPTGLAVGVEYRKEFSDAQFDPLTAAGLNGGNALPRTVGSFDVVEGYAELAVPILRDVPFFHMLEARGAVRVSDYSTVGTTYSWNYGLEWAPIPEIRFRAVKARATRAPNIGELFAPPGQTFPPGLQDPCVGVGASGNAPTTGALGDVCRADAGVRQNIAQNGVFTLNQSDLQNISGFNSGNPGLGEEKGDSLTIGAVINPTSIDWLRNFALTVDYFDIEVKDAIVFTPRQFILDQCYVQGEASFCEFIQRRQGQEGQNSPGSLNIINSGPTNSGGLKTSGIDFTLSYRQNLENWGLAGRLNARLSWTHVFKAYVVPLPGADKDRFNREVGASRNKAFASLSYEYENWGATLRGTYIGPAYLDDQFTGVVAGEEGSEDFKIGSEFIADLQLRFTPGDHYEFYIGADNLLDNAAPLLPGSLPGSTTGVNTSAGTYDPIGRRFYAGARLKF